MNVHVFVMLKKTNCIQKTMDQLFHVKCGGEKIILLPKHNMTIEIPTTQTDNITIRPTEVGIIAKEESLEDEKNVYEIIEKACQEQNKPSWPEGTLAKPVMEYKAIDMIYFKRIPLPTNCPARAQEIEQLFVGAAPKYTPINRAKDVLHIMEINNKQDLKQITSEELMTWVCEFAIDIVAGMKTMEVAGYIHNDLKLANIVYDQRDKRFKLLDFGNSVKFKNIVPSIFVGEILAYSHIDEDNGKIIVPYMNPIIQAFHDFMRVTRKHVYNSNRAFTVLRNADMWSLWNMCANLLFDGLFSIERGNEYPDRVQELAHIFMKPVKDIHDHRMVNMIQSLSEEYIQKRQLHKHFNDGFRRRMREMTWRQGLVQGRSLDEAYTKLLDKLDNPFDLPETMDDMSYETVLSQAPQPSRKRSLSSSSVHVSPKRKKASQPSEANKQSDPNVPAPTLDINRNCIIHATNFTHLDNYSTADKHDTIPKPAEIQPTEFGGDGYCFWYAVLGCIACQLFPPDTPAFDGYNTNFDNHGELTIKNLKQFYQNWKKWRQTSNPNPNKQMAQWLLRTTRLTYPNQEMDIQGDMNDFPQVLQVVWDKLGQVLQQHGFTSSGLLVYLNERMTYTFGYTHPVIIDSVQQETIFKNNQTRDHMFIIPIWQTNTVAASAQSQNLGDFYQQHGARANQGQGVGHYKGYTRIGCIHNVAQASPISQAVPVVAQPLSVSEKSSETRPTSIESKPQPTPKPSFAFQGFNTFAKTSKTSYTPEPLTIRQTESKVTTKQIIERGIIPSDVFPGFSVMVRPWRIVAHPHYTKNTIEENPFMCVMNILADLHTHFRETDAFSKYETFVKLNQRAFEPILTSENVLTEKGMYCDAFLFWVATYFSINIRYVFKDYMKNMYPSSTVFKMDDDNQQFVAPCGTRFFYYCKRTAQMTRDHAVCSITFCHTISSNEQSSFGIAQFTKYDKPREKFMTPEYARESLPCDFDGERLVEPLCDVFRDGYFTQRSKEIKDNTLSLSNMKKDPTWKVLSKGGFKEKKQAFSFLHDFKRILLNIQNGDGVCTIFVDEMRNKEKMIFGNEEANIDRALREKKFVILLHVRCYIVLDARGPDIVATYVQPKAAVKLPLRIRNTINHFFRDKEKNDLISGKNTFVHTIQLQHENAAQRHEPCVNNVLTDVYIFLTLVYVVLNVQNDRPWYHFPNIMMDSTHLSDGQSDPGILFKHYLCEMMSKKQAPGCERSVVAVPVNPDTRDSTFTTVYATHVVNIPQTKNNTNTSNDAQREDSGFMSCSPCEEC